ncbi:predicted protein [Arabidopsis lyrata subsp. lyrata]|uniref:Predicted protein n=1 Tax=Arabidopsis lyrata subsp. lyrata TaxID=81972 RepID=D7KNS1_ARALL|nr:predicted protein [Arabidopsis lyrata subsp. lyrata]
MRSRSDLWSRDKERTKSIPTTPKKINSRTSNRTETKETTTTAIDAQIQQGRNTMNRQKQPKTSLQLETPQNLTDDRSTTRSRLKLSREQSLRESRVLLHRHQLCERSHHQNTPPTLHKPNKLTNNYTSEQERPCSGAVEATGASQRDLDLFLERRMRF